MFQPVTLLKVTMLLHIMACIGCQQSSLLSYDQLRERYFTILVASDADPTDSIVQSRISTLDISADTLWSSMNKNSDRKYLWETDKKPEYIPGALPHGAVSSKVTVSFGKLVQLALAYRTNGSKFHNNSQLKKDIVEGMDWMLANHYNPSIEWYDNWWDWVIGIPMTLNNLLVLMYSELDKEQLDKAMESMHFFAPDVTYEGASTGANKVWQCKIMALRGIISHNPKQLKMAIDGLDSEFKYVTSKDGFYRDGSFVQHQWHPYTGGYGRSLLRELVDIIVMVDNSEWEVPEKNVQMIYEWIQNSFVPVIYRGALMDMVRGREASRTESDRMAGHSLLLSFIRLSQIAPEKEKSYLQSFVKTNILEDRYRDFLTNVPSYLLSTTKEILSDQSIAPMESKSLNKIFAAMDRVVHIQPEFAFGLSMSSSRIENYETINGENLKGWHTGDGMTYLYDNDLRQYSDNFWPTVNAYRLPGTTEDTRPREAKTLPFGEGLLYADGYKSPRNWVGGSSICGKYGIAGMWFNAQDCSLEAKKSWMMVGDEIVAVGTGINSKDNRTIETTVENRKMNDTSIYHFHSDGNEILTSDGEWRLNNCHWVHFESENDQSSIGYYFPEQPILNVQKKVHTGTWFEINQLYRLYNPIDRRYFTLWFDHGKNPLNDTYTYVLLPGKNLAETEKYAKNPNSIILVNTPQVQAIHNKRENVTGINFWEASDSYVKNISVDAPASVIIKETSDELVIGISDPTQSNKTISVIVDRDLNGIKTSDPEIEVLEISPQLKLKVNVNNALGSTRSITLKK